ncbi:hypothetical protein INT45_006568 [Circinella minor]|uniref:Uncharacterized protein n=1 Tax=Circinella minor TaxID=1195481 RepID=A0A8H7S004_9FUNG|nr:hypothetical protein INT45_006568 [Circinella minor]
MRIKFFQSSSSTSSNKGGGGSTALDDASFISSSSGTSQSSWHQQQQRASTEPRRGKSPYYQQESSQQQQQQNRPKTLNTVMQLFDHDSQQSIKRNNNNNNNNDNNNVSSIDNPYRIKANGAVVINRTTHMTDHDDLLLHGTNSTGLSSHISTTSSFETNSVMTTTNPSISQPITTAPFFESEDTVLQHTTSTSSSSGGSSSSRSNSKNDHTHNKENNSTLLSSTPKSIHPSTKQQQQSTKMRMESNSSRSTFPIHDTTRFSMDGDSICSMESWTSSMIMEPLEEEDNNNNNNNNTHYLPNEQSHHQHHHHHHHHVTALSPPPRNTTKKWERGRIYSSDIDDICETLTTMNENSIQQEHSLLSPPLSIPPTSSSSSALQQHHEQDASFNNWHTMFELVNQENIRLRHQLQREQKEHDENYKHQTEILVNTRRENKYLKSTLSRIEMLSHTDAAYNKEKKRRQSTGEITLLFPPLGGEEEKGGGEKTTRHEKGKEPMMTLSNRRFHGSSVTLTYERKIKILLDEIEGMQAEEEMMYTRRSKLATKNNMLERHLLAREESVKQLEHDLRIMRLQM